MSECFKIFLYDIESEENLKYHIFSIEENNKNGIIDTEDMNNVRDYNFIICVSGEQVKL